MNKSYSLKFVKDGQLTHEEWASIEDFKSSPYCNALLDWGVETDGNVLIDLTEWPITSNQIRTILLGDVTRYFSSSLSKEFSIDDVVWSDLMDRYILEQYAHVAADTEEIGTYDYLIQNGYVRMNGEFYSQDNDDIVFCVDIEEYCWSEDAYWCDEDGEYYYNEPDDVYRGDNGDGYIHSYHGSRHLHRDLSGNAVKTIGFEVEKLCVYVNGNERHDGYLGHENLFRYERDSSLGRHGVECITHTLSAELEDVDSTITLFRSAEGILNGRVNADCGGHITFAVRGLNKVELATKLKPAIPILMSIWRKRLKNHHCRTNIRMDLERRGRDMLNLSKQSNSLVELRLPPAIKDLSEMEYRYKLMAVMLNAIIDEGHDDTGEILTIMLPVIKERYPNTWEERIELVEDFAKATFMSLEDLGDGKCPEAVAEYYQNYLSNIQREIVRAQNEALRTQRNQTQHGVIVEALMNPRRRARTQELGSQFMLSWADEGGRRLTRTIYVTADGLAYNNDYGRWGRERRVIESNPENFRVTVTCNGVPVEWRMLRRAGEDLGYYAVATQDAVGHYHMETPTWASLERLHPESNIYGYRESYSSRERTLIVVDENSIITTRRHRTWHDERPKIYLAVRASQLSRTVNNAYQHLIFEEIGEARNLMDQEEPRDRILDLVLEYEARLLRMTTNPQLR